MTSEIFVHLHSPARFSSWFDVLTEVRSERGSVTTVFEKRGERQKFPYLLLLLVRLYDRLPLPVALAA